MPESITAAAFVELVKRGESCCVVDVRTLPEYREVRIASCSLHAPLDELSPDAVRKVAGNSGKPIYILCNGGVRAKKAADILRRSGIEQATVVEGGLDACLACGADVVRGQVMPLERQVRVAAGVLVLLGVVLGVAVSPAFYALAAFVGCGLVFSGITGWCGMAMLLAKAPWNR